MFKGKKDKFNVLLANISSNLLESANYFADYKLNNEQDLKAFSEEKKDLKRKVIHLLKSDYRIKPRIHHSN